MLSLGVIRKGQLLSRRVTLGERDTECVVCSHLGMQTTTVSKLKIPDSMIRDETTAVWKNGVVTCLRFPAPVNAFHNRWASEIMNREILGNVILISLEGVTAEEVNRYVDKKTFRPTSWSSLARRLPKEIPIDKEAKERKMNEELERQMAWRKHEHDEPDISESEGSESDY